MSFSKLFCCPVKAAVAKRERRKEARPGELLDAALALFVEKGFAATKVEEVAARAGVSKGTLFLYFQNKEENRIERVYSNKIQYIFITDEDGWISILEETETGYIGIVQAADREHALSYVGLREYAYAGMQSLV